MREEQPARGKVGGKKDARKKGGENRRIVIGFPSLCPCSRVAARHLCRDQPYNITTVNLLKFNVAILCDNPNRRVRARV